MATRSFLYDIQVTLLDMPWPVWRRLLVPSTITFKKFHEAIQIAMGWQNYHLFEFRYGPIAVSIPDEDFLVDDFHYAARWKKLSSLNLSTSDILSYLYDFGDNWVHLLHIKGVRPLEHRELAVRCTGGEGACPPADVGGPYGYEQFLQTIYDSEDPEANHLIDWAGGAFDPWAFDRNHVNKEMAQRFKK